MSIVAEFASELHKAHSFPQTRMVHLLLIRLLRKNYRTSGVHI